MKMPKCMPWVVVGLFAASLRGESASSSGSTRLDAVLRDSAEAVKALRENRARLDDPAQQDLRAAIDHAANQRDAYASGLHWHKNLDAAKAEAKRLNRPILSLRLLGNLDEEYSCANSRFFRTVLYANAEVSRVLRENYVLHWKSVRPAPLLTIDMGDGRRIKRTITGNSIHYVLDAQGQVLDALPGVYSPQAFLMALARVSLHLRDHSPGEIRDWHGREAHQLCLEWLNEALRCGVYGEAVQKVARQRETIEKRVKQAFPAWKGPVSGELVMVPQQCMLRFDGLEQKKQWETAVDSLVVEVLGRQIVRKAPAQPVPWKFPEDFDPPSEFDPPKAMVERPVMKKALPGQANTALDPASPELSTESLSGRMTAAWWAKMAERFVPTVLLDESSRRLMMQKLPREVVSDAEWKSGAVTDENTPFARMLRRFEAAIARDMLRNEYFYHTQIHQWLEEDKDGRLSADVEELNRRVYAELFLTPDYDAWLGLVPEDTYTALEKDGCACDPGAPAMRQTVKNK